MAISTPLRMGAESLQQKSLPVTDLADPSLPMLIQQLKETMIEANGVGIAAPQIGKNLRVIMFGFDKNPRYPQEEPVPFTVLINPEFEILTDKEVLGWEGCLSVPGLRGLVPRYEKIRYSGMDEQGNAIERVASEFHARVVQHEIDHINGVLYPQRIRDMKYFGFEDELFASSSLG